MIKLDIIAQTDFAGAIEKTYHCPGGAKVAGLISSIRDKNQSGTLLLDAGDILCAAPIVNLTDGTPVVRFVNTLGVDAMALGNHEFDNGKAAMEHALSVATFPILCANVYKKGTKELIAKPYVTIDKAGVSIGIIGVTTEYTPFMLKNGAFDDYDIVSAKDALNEYIPIVRGMCDVVIVLSHLPVNMDGDGKYTGELIETLEAVPDADVFIGGHNVGFVSGIYKNTLLMKAGFSAAHIAHGELWLDEKHNIVKKSAHIHDMMAENIAPIDSAQLLVDEIMAPFRAELDEVLATLPVRLDVDVFNECALGNFYTDGLRKTVDAKIGLFNATSIFGYMPKGDVTYEMIRHVMCFDEPIYKGEMSGKQLYELFERTYEEEHFNYNCAVQFSGLRLVIDTRLPVGQRVVSLFEEDGTSIAPDRLYTVATTDYIAGGGNDYKAVMQQTNWQDSGCMTHSSFRAFLKKQGVIPCETDGRITNLDPKPFYIDRKRGE